VSPAFPLLLCYHAASSTWRHALATPADEIERQISRLLRRGYSPVRCADVLHRRGRVLHVTFDDAFRSALSVLPALERMGVTVTIFVATEFAEAGAPLVVPELAREPHEELLTLPWDELAELAARGVAIESHTGSHPHLPSLGDAELRRELRESKERIEDMLARRCIFLAYPFGDEDERVRREARRAGYDAAFTVSGRLRPLDRFALPRVGVYGDESALRRAYKLSRPGRVLEGRRR
jgi:peptidoglycan/xylan/chitin deacetylase (PgdA/CDA1 family)